jgi:pyruvate/2-oxoglutarate dehydrogenase complex dihydrolipoamide dehydrogenase (E3) component
MYDFELVAIGAGTAGLTVSRLVAASGRGKVGLVEEGRPGGDCLWTGCVPSKALVEIAKVARTVRSSSRFGVLSEWQGVSFDTLRDRISNAQQLAGRVDSPEAIASHGVELISGRARFLDPHTIRVGGRQISARYFVVATGSEPVLPPIDGLSESQPETSDTFWGWDSLPNDIIIIGAGAIGCELAQSLARLGTDVTLLEATPGILGNETRKAGEQVRRVLEEEGVRVETGVSVEMVNRTGGRYEVVWSRAGERGEESSACLLVAGGRRPSVDGLDLRRAGVRVGRHGIVVDSRMRTTAPHIFAAGDVTGGPQFTHVAEDQARTVANVINGHPLGRFGWNARVVPRVTFTDPEVASVGLTAEEARQKYGRKARVWTMPLSEVDRAITADSTEGFLEIVTVPGWERFIPLVGKSLGQQIAGATFVAPNAGELLPQVVTGMRLRIPAGLLALNAQAYPTFALGVRQALGLAFERADRRPGARPDTG